MVAGTSRRFRWCFIILLFVGSLRIVAAQPAPSLSQPSPQVVQQPKSTQVYSLPPDKLAKARTLNKIRLTLDIVGTFWGLAVLWWLLESHTAARLEGWAQRTVRRRSLQGLLFFAAFVLITTIAGLPIGMIGHTASRHYAISVQEWGSWFTDQSKALAIALAGTPVFLLFNWIVRRWPRRYWLGIWVAMVPLMLAVTAGSPFIEPFFNQYEPLAKNHSALVAELQKVVARTGTQIPPERMFLMKASLKSNGLNAYVSGVGPTRRIVVWDTTAGRIPDDEIMFIFGHESAHYVLRHIAKGLAISAVSFLLIFWACAKAGDRLAERFGARWGIHPQDNEPALATRTGFLILILMVSVVSFLLEPVSNSVSRYFEHQADVYGQEAIHGLVADPQKTAISGFNHLGEAWLEDPDPNRFVEFWTYSHPSVQNRATFAAYYDPWANGGHGEFFKD